MTFLRDPQRPARNWLSAVLRGSLSFLARKPDSPKPLWLGARYTNRDRDLAVERGLQFIGHIASNPKHFQEWGYDLLWCFHTISNTAKNEHLREMAHRMGQACARQWLQEHVELPADDADELTGFVFGLDAAERLLGVHDEALQYRVQKAAAHYSATDFLEFDPTLEPPPADVPDWCTKCDHRNPRGVTRCQKCDAPLTFQSPYTLWQEALVTTYTGHIYGVHFGASYRDVVQWISAMRPYPESMRLKLNQAEFDDVTYAITHLVYTLNDYGKYRLSPAWLPQELVFLRSNLREAERFNDSETLGEFLDTLRAFGADEGDAVIRAGMDYLLSHQNQDGSWGKMDDDDIYNRYHTTWTAVDGLREYLFHEERLMFPDMMPLIQCESINKTRKQAGGVLL
jgi:hypothetical protein